MKTPIILGNFSDTSVDRVSIKNFAGVSLQD
jgi:hypothetical protein